MMDCVSLPLSRVPKTSKLLVDYLAGRESITRFYNGSPFDPATYQRLTREIATPQSGRKQLAEVLLRQNESFGAGDPTLENIRRLADADTVAVVTGQQVGLFSGPAFTLYKALTAVRLSQSLVAGGLKAVPVFWLATEDHDLEEVSQTYTLDHDYHLVHLHDPGERPAPQSPVGRVTLTEAVTEQIKRFESLLPPGDQRARVMEDLREAYQPGVAWPQAFARFLTRLFGRWGVILLDPMDEALHRLAAPFYQQALRQADELRLLLQKRSAELTEAGYHAQVHVGDNSTLLFAEREGSRLPIQTAGGSGPSFLTGGEHSATLEELEAGLDAYPLSFSANVLLRPVVQDALLPTVAYVAGPSEVAYLGQAQVLYSALGRPMPAVFPRSGFTLLDRRTGRWMEKYRLEVDDVWQGKDHLSERIASTALAKGWPERFEQTERDLEALLMRLRKDIQEMDPTLLDALGHAEEKIQYQLERLKGRMTRSALSRSEVLARHEQALLQAVTPDHELQERQVSGVYFLGRAGYQLLDDLLQQIPADSSVHCVMSF